VILILLDGVLRAVVGSSTGRPLAILLAGIYATGFVGAGGGRTPGMAVAGIRVADVKSGQSIGYARALLRWAFSYVSAAAVLIGFGWMLWDDDRQCWHDKVARNYVVEN
jgi:uncharacterized RDD family membrane protein YckC